MFLMTVSIKLKSIIPQKFTKLTLKNKAFLKILDPQAKNMMSILCKIDVDSVCKFYIDSILFFFLTLNLRKIDDFYIFFQEKKMTSVLFKIGLATF